MAVTFTFPAEVGDGIFEGFGNAIIIDLGEEYAGKSFTIYSGRKSTKVKVTEGEFDKNGKFVFEVPDGKNYTLVIEE
ncbi:MAG: hypothetical protein J5997_12175 [Oscillospiraceae bacterium]|nr:hypothetical protein [Oscillospiraceae bacterium]